ISDLKKKESTLKSQQKTQQKKADQLNSQIQAKIAEEIKRQQELEKKKDAEAKKKQQQSKSTTTTSGNGSTTTKPTTTTPSYTMSKEDQLVAGGFEKNKGRLPMPVEKGFISGHFGRQPHPVLQYVTQDNKGIYIQTPAGSYARAVYDGVVTQVFHVAGSNTSVIVKHGNYRTVYSNLTAVTVKTGEKVTAKQRLGKVFVDAENGNKAELYFMLYKDSAIQNPESWIAK
ncbi:MAG: M23 family metallopeptidase, partial [Bacteroidales bacterium]|nr:M23 family metallopeptidase [Bacteroidales bacterium]